MKLTMKQLAASRDALSMLGSLPLPAAVAFKVAKVLKTASPVLDVYQEVFNKKLVEFGTPMEGSPGQYVVSDAMKASWEAEVKALQDQEFEIEDVKLSVSELGDAKVPASVLFTLEWMITA